MIRGIVAIAIGLSLFFGFSWVAEHSRIYLKSLVMPDAWFDAIVIAIYAVFIIICAVAAKMVYPKENRERFFMTILFSIGILYLIAMAPYIGLFVSWGLCKIGGHDPCVESW